MLKKSIETASYSGMSSHRHLNLSKNFLTLHWFKPETNEEKVLHERIVPVASFEMTQSNLPLTLFVSIPFIISVSKIKRLPLASFAWPKEES